MSFDKPFSQACENNKQPILQVLERVFNRPLTVWEIGSGTGQHACYFSRKLPHICWQPSDRSENIAGIMQWVDAANLKNLRQPVELDVTDIPWPCENIEGLFTANTLHIMSWQQVECLFARLNGYLNSGALMCMYGPFNYHGEYTSASNAQFDQWLKSRDPQSGVRDIEAIIELAISAGIELLEDVALPANNRLLIWQKC